MTMPYPQVTADELLEQKSEGGRRELVAGKIVTEPPASFRHGSVAAEIFALLSEFTRRHDLGRVVSTETGFLLARQPDTVRAPDVAFLAHSTIRSAGTFRGFFPGAPDLVVEVLSPSERAADIHGKVADYLACGTRRIWVVDSSRRSVLVYRELLRPITLTADDVLDGEELLPGFRVSVSLLFPD